MNITPSEFTDNLTAYIDKEVIPSISTIWQQVLLGAGLALAKKRIDDIVVSVAENPIVKTLGIIDVDGDIDVDIMLNSISESMNKYSNGELQIDAGAILGNFTFTQKDVDKLKSYMRTKQPGKRQAATFIPAEQAGDPPPLDAVTGTP